jgi:non-specific protein-tyrosine kinase
MDENIEIKEIIRALQKNWIWVLISVVAGGFLAFVISSVQSPVYQAKTTILVGQVTQVNEINRDQIAAGEILVQTYAVLIRRQPILEQVIEDLELDKGWRSLREDVSVSIVPETQIIEISVDAESPELAESIAAGIADQLILFSSENSRPQQDEFTIEFIDSQLRILQERINSGQVQLSDLRAQSGSNLSIERLAEIETEIQILERLITDWETNYAELLAVKSNSQSQANVFLIDKAEARNRPIRPNTRLNLIIGVGVGFFLAGGIIFFRIYSDQTVKTSRDLQTIFGVELLGTVPTISGKGYQNKTPLDKAFPRNAQESYRVILNNLDFITKLRSPKSILIISSEPGEGKSLTSANLAINMALSGKKIVLVDADFRRPVLHQIFKIENRKGLGDLLWPDERKLEDFLQPTAVGNLKVLSSGSDPLNPTARLRSEEMDSLLSDLKESSDMIIFDGPPVASIADGLVLSSLVDSVILVGSIGKTRIDAAKRAMENLRIANASLIGFVVNRVSQNEFGY